MCCDREAGYRLTKSPHLPSEHKLIGESTDHVFTYCMIVDSLPTLCSHQKTTKHIPPPAANTSTLFSAKRKKVAGEGRSDRALMQNNVLLCHSNYAF